ncbi:hypothetical protein PAMC26577_19905 [Caballeronia sordidicola]|uniref:Lipoprotein n=1 Tax=Caballeronia sordidicola TaxID=196367 RepID=A0A242MNA0_CABSO|nr:hypothetical protein PAMC26577_19905 [Caballeronia sordidicola]
MGAKTKILIVISVMVFLSCIAIGVSKFKWQGIDLGHASRGSISGAHAP